MSNFQSHNLIYHLFATKKLELAGLANRLTLTDSHLEGKPLGSGLGLQYLQQLDTLEAESKVQIQEREQHIQEEGMTLNEPAYTDLPSRPNSAAFEIKLGLLDRLIKPIGYWRQLRALKRYKKALLRYQIILEKAIAANERELEAYRQQIQDIQQQISLRKQGK